MKTDSKVFLYGSAHLTRATIPEVLADFAALPTVDTAALSEQDVARYEANLEAYRLFVLETDVSLAEIRRRTGVQEKQLYRLLNRVMSPAADNQIQGLRGLIPGKHLKSYILRAIRLEQGISQEKLALLAEVDRSYVGRVERGDNNVALLTLAALSEALGLKISAVLIRADL